MTPTQATPATLEDIQTRRRLAMELMRSGTDASPVQHWTQGLARVSQALVGGYQNSVAGKDQLARESYDKSQAEAQKAKDRAYSEGQMQREAQQRAQLATQYGVKPGTPEYQRLILTGQYSDPLEAEYKRAQIQKMQQGGDAPASIEEWNVFSRMTPEQQQQYLSMKRANEAVIGDTIYSKGTGQPIANVGPALQRGEAQKELGTATGKQMAAAPGDLAAADTALELIDSIRNDPNRAAGTSTLSPIGNVIPKTDGFAFQLKVDQAKSGAFLTAIQQLRGMGALSNAEGQTATAAVTRMNTATSDKDFEEALRDYESVILRGRRQAEKIMRERDKLMQPDGGQPQGQAPAAPQSGGVDLKSKYGLE